jgi:hypothetical protein
VRLLALPAFCARSRFSVQKRDLFSMNELVVIGQEPSIHAGLRDSGLLRNDTCQTRLPPITLAPKSMGRWPMRRRFWLHSASNASRWSSPKTVWPRPFCTDMASDEATHQTLALLIVLALGQREVASGKVKLPSEVVARLKAKRAMV